MNGNIQIWDLTTSSEKQTFQGHRAAVTCLCFDKLGGRLISGANVTFFFAFKKKTFPLMFIFALTLTFLCFLGH
jgi:WD40 repeat protein